MKQLEEWGDVVKPQGDVVIVIDQSDSSIIFLERQKNSQPDKPELFRELYVHSKPGLEALIACAFLFGLEWEDIRGLLRKEEAKTILRNGTAVLLEQNAKKTTDEDRLKILRYLRLVIE